MAIPLSKRSWVAMQEANRPAFPNEERWWPDRITGVIDLYLPLWS
jgi:hypothetical protein